MPLVEVLREQAEGAKFAISYHDQPQDAVRSGVNLSAVPGGLRKGMMVERGFDRALQFKMDFSPDADMSILERWVED